MASARERSACKPDAYFLKGIEYSELSAAECKKDRLCLESSCLNLFTRERDGQTCASFNVLPSLARAAASSNVGWSSQIKETTIPHLLSFAPASRMMSSKGCPRAPCQAGNENKSAQPLEVLEETAGAQPIIAASWECVKHVS